jgi:hypothetical protein
MLSLKSLLSAGDLANAPAVYADVHVHGTEILDPSYISSKSVASVCSMWNKFLSQLSLRSVSQTSFSVSFTVVRSLEENSLTASNTVTCTHLAAVKTVNGLTNGISGLSSSATSVLCTNNVSGANGTAVWSVGICNGIVYLNVSSMSSSFGYRRLSPCADACETHDNAFEAGIVRMLSVSFTDKHVAPVVVSKAIQVFKSSILVKLSLRSIGNAFCSAYLTSSYSPPSSANEIVGVAVAGFGSTTNSTVFNINITGLIPSSSYTVLCLTSSFGVYSPLQSVINDGIVISTLCCKEITVTLTTKSVFAGIGSKANALIISSSGLTSTPMRLVIGSYFVAADSRRLIGTNSLSLLSTDPSAGSYLSPTSMAIAAGSAINIPVTLLSPAVVGTLTVNITLAGSSASGYVVSYSNGYSISIIPTSQQPPAPQLLSATFSSDGSYVTVVFDADTNRGGQGKAAFVCSNLLNFTSAKLSSCQWDSQGRVVTVKLPTATTLMVTDLVTLKANKLRSGCVTSIGANCSSWTAAIASSVRVRAPAQPSAPSVIVSAPRSVGACDALTIDLTASRGSGGRAWTSVQFSVDSAAVNVSDLQLFLNRRAYLAELIISASRQYLNAGSLYAVRLTLCNFLGSCGQGSFTFSVLSIQSPFVNILGPSMVSIFRRSALTLKATTFLATCDGSSPSAASLQYEWSAVRTQGGLLLSVDNVFSPTLYILPYSLAASFSYTLAVTVYSSTTKTSSTASTLILVGQGSLVAVIAGGTSVTSRATEKLSVDGSGSYDEDQDGATNVLQFDWSCYQLLPVFAEGCPVTLRNESTPIVGFISSTTSINSTVIVVNSVSLGSRSATAQITVFVASASVPKIVIKATVQSVTNVNTADKIAVLADVNFADNPVYCAWAVSESAVDLSAAALTSTSKTFTPTAQSLGQSGPFNLVLKPNALTPNAEYTMILTCALIVGFEGSSALSSTSIIVISTNGPPTPGSLSVSPAYGMELVDIFRFEAASWSDIGYDYPLTYVFGFISPVDGGLLAVSSRLQLAAASTSLPRGPVQSNFSIESVLHVFDSLDASEVAIAQVFVGFADLSSNTTAVSQLLSNRITRAGQDTDGIKQAVLSTTVFANSCNCSSAPNCTNLNRRSCFSTTNTCGECIDSALYIGLSGPSNEPCVPVAAFLRQRQQSLCRTDDDCSLDSQYCDVSSGYCQYNNKTCDPACVADKGVCSFTSLVSGNSRTSCALMDTSCTAACVCSLGYYGVSCGLSDDELLQKQSLRKILVGAVGTIITSESSLDNSTIAGWSNSLAAAAAMPLELDEAATRTVLGLINSVIDVAASALDQPASAIYGLFTALDSCASTALALKSTRRLASNVNGTLIAASVRIHLDALSYALAEALLAGEAVSVYLFDSFRMSQQILTSANPGSISVEYNAMMLPQLNNENVSGIAVSSVSVPVAGLQQQQISASSLKSSIFESSTDGVANPVRVQFEVTEVCNTLSPVILKFSHSQSLNLSTLTATTDNITYSTVCLRNGESTAHSYKCPYSTNISHVCPGDKDFTLTSTCPQRRYQHSCSSISADDENVTCETLSVSDTTTVCACYPCNLTSIVRRKLASSSASEANKFAFEAQAIGSYVLTDYVDITESALAFTVADVGETSLVLSLFACIWGVMLLSVPLVEYGKVVDKLESRTLKYGIGLGHGTKTVGSLHRVAPAVAGGIGALNEQDMHGAAVVKDKLSQQQRAVEYLKDYVFTFFPNIFSDRPERARFWHQVIHKHRYLVVFTRDTVYHKCVTILETLSLLTCYMFLTAVLYDVEWPNDDSFCQSQYSQTTCLQKKSVFDAAKSMCRWSIVEDTSQYACVWIKPDFDPIVQIIIMMLVVAISGPLNVVISLLVYHVLLAPTKAEKIQSENAVFQTRTQVIQAVVPVDLGSGGLDGKGRDHDPAASKTQLHGVAQIQRTSQSFLHKMSLSRGSVLFPSVLDVDKELIDYIDGDQRLRNECMLEALVDKGAGVVVGSDQQGQIYPSPTKLHSKVTIEAKKPTALRTSVDTRRQNVFADAQHFVKQIQRIHRKLRERRRPYINFEDQWGMFLQPKDAAIIEVSTGADGVRSELTTAGAYHAQRKTVPDYVDVDVGKLQTELDAVVREAKDVILRFENKPPRVIGIQILQLFVLDLLGRHSREAQIFANQRAAVKSKRVVGWYSKSLCIASLVAVNGYFVFMCMLYAESKGREWQVNWSITCMIYLLVDIFIKHVNIVYVIHYYIPELISARTRAMKLRVHRAINKLVANCLLGTNQEGPTVNPSEVNGSRHSEFSVSDYLFVSAHVARAFPHLLESSIISSYRSLFSADPQVRTLCSRTQQPLPSREGWNVILRTSVINTVASTLLLLGCQQLFVQYLVVQTIDPVILGLMAFIGSTIFHSSYAGVFLLIGVFALISLCYSFGLFDRSITFLHDPLQMITYTKSSTAGKLRKLHVNQINRVSNVSVKRTVVAPNGEVNVEGHHESHEEMQAHDEADEEDLYERLSHSDDEDRCIDTNDGSRVACRIMADIGEDFSSDGDDGDGGYRDAEYADFPPAFRSSVKIHNTGSSSDFAEADSGANSENAHMSIPINLCHRESKQTPVHNFGIDLDAVFEVYDSDSDLEADGVDARQDVKARADGEYLVDEEDDEDIDIHNFLDAMC